jgi:hypothetical protein
MLRAEEWVEPRIEWLGTLDVTNIRARLSAAGELLVTWPPTQFERTATDCYRLQDEFWVWQPYVGAVTFSLDRAGLAAFLWPGADSAWFRQVVTRSWLPAIYPLWGRQVVHASAVVCEATQESVAFVGTTHAGKSTLAYGMRQRSGWNAISDDMLAFSVHTGSPSEPQSILLHPMPQEARLRPASAAYYGRTDQATETLAWPGGAPRLRVIYILDGDEHLETAASFRPLRPAEVLPLLLEQAYALSLNLPTYNQELMKQYAVLATTVSAFRLHYRRSFNVAEQLFTSIRGHLAGEAGITCGQRRS